ncbi:MAG: hypothetical protein R6U89_08090 [Dehalococcoidia bacterium]
MNLLSKTDLREIIENSRQPCISIYMPAERTGVETRANPTRLKNLIRNVEEQLDALGYESRQTGDILAPAVDLVDDAGFWRQQDDGLAILASPGIFRYWQLPLRFDEVSVAASHFYLKPVMPLLSSDGRFFVLALSQNNVRLLESTRYDSREVGLEDTPKSLKEALKYDDSERQVQFHTPEPGGKDKAGQAAIFHAHGVGEEDEKKDIIRFVQQVDNGVVSKLASGGEPLILAGAEPTIGLYRKVNSYGNLIEEIISGNPDDMSNDYLREQAWTIIEPYFAETRARIAEKFQDLRASDLASSKLREVLPAAWQGRVDTIFAATDARQWGTFDGAANRLRFHQEREPGDEDLINLAILYTFVNSGTVYVVEQSEVPGASGVAAIYRY